MNYYLTEEGRKFKNRIPHPHKKRRSLRSGPIASAYEDEAGRKAKRKGGTPEEVEQARRVGLRRGMEAENRGEGQP